MSESSDSKLTRGLPLIGLALVVSLSGCRTTGLNLPRLSLSRNAELTPDPTDELPAPSSVAAAMTTTEIDNADSYPATSTPDATMPQVEIVQAADTTTDASLTQNGFYGTPSSIPQAPNYAGTGGVASTPAPNLQPLVPNPSGLANQSVSPSSYAGGSGGYSAAVNRSAAVPPAGYGQYGPVVSQQPAGYGAPPSNTTWPQQQYAQNGGAISTRVNGNTVAGVPSNGASLPPAATALPATTVEATSGAGGGTRNSAFVSNGPAAASPASFVPGPPATAPATPANPQFNAPAVFQSLTQAAAAPAAPPVAAVPANNGTFANSGSYAINGAPANGGAFPTSTTPAASYAGTSPPAHRSDDCSEGSCAIGSSPANSPPSSPSVYQPNLANQPWRPGSTTDLR